MGEIGMSRNEKIAPAPKKEREKDAVVKAPPVSKKTENLKKVYVFSKQVKHGVGGVRTVYEKGALCPDSLIESMTKSGSIEEAVV